MVNTALWHNYNDPGQRHIKALKWRETTNKIKMKINNSHFPIQSVHPFKCSPT